MAPLAVRTDEIMGFLLPVLFSQHGKYPPVGDTTTDKAQYEKAESHIKNYVKDNLGRGIH